ncbi:hypothetical protein DH2020_024457 [Rehmannia glutinosa]|uniref:Secreted protein n=1 Tax=Rehmannia glutinosa TaxID=99300 RepID=A0ABR0W6A9_REHGL
MATTLYLHCTRFASQVLSTLRALPLGSLINSAISYSVVAPACALTFLSPAPHVAGSRISLYFSSFKELYFMSASVMQTGKITAYVR